MLLSFLDNDISAYLPTVSASRRLAALQGARHR